MNFLLAPLHLLGQLFSLETGLHFRMRLSSECLTYYFTKQQCPKGTSRCWWKFGLCPWWRQMVVLHLTVIGRCMKPLMKLKLVVHLGSVSRQRLTTTYLMMHQTGAGSHTISGIITQTLSSPTCLTILILLMPSTLAHILPWVLMESSIGMMLCQGIMPGAMQYAHIQLILQVFILISFTM